MREGNKMNRQEFMTQLERLLWDISENDRQDAIAYYNDYFDEAGVENEAKVTAELGSPGKVAAIIKADLNSSGNEWAEYTENGYKDNRMNQGENPISKREVGYKEPKGRVKIPLVLVIILLIFALPLLLGVGGGLIGLVFGIFGAMIGVIAAVVGGCVSGFVGGIAGLAYGIAKVLFNPTQGLLYIGIGSLALAMGVFLALLILWSIGKWIPALLRIVVNFIQRLVYKNERGSQV